MLCQRSERNSQSHYIMNLTFTNLIMKLCEVCSFIRQFVFACEYSGLKNDY